MKQSKNQNLHKARNAKNDEFYTQLTDIEKELKHYKEQFKDKIVYCNCDDPYESNFFKHFAMSFNFLGLKKLIATCYMGSPIANKELILFDNESAENKTTRVPHKIIINEFTDENNDGAEDLQDIVISLAKNQKNTLTRLKGDGDFRSAECIELLKEADIICTNPPFSLFREYVAQLIEYDKKFLILGNINNINYKIIFSLMKENRLRLGRSISSGDREFRVPDYYPLEASGIRVDEEDNRYIRVKGVRWFTNLDISKYEEDLVLWKKYTPEEYPKFDNYDAINVDKTNEIPKDYDGVMGVPITFMDKYNPNQFEIIGLGIGNLGKELGIKKYREEFKEYTKITGLREGTLYLVKNGKPKVCYSRVLIRAKDLRFK